MLFPELLAYYLSLIRAVYPEVKPPPIAFLRKVYALYAEWAQPHSATLAHLCRASFWSARAREMGVTLPSPPAFLAQLEAPQDHVWSSLADFKHADVRVSLALQSSLMEKKLKEYFLLLMWYTY